VPSGGRARKLARWRLSRKTTWPLSGLAGEFQETQKLARELIRLAEHDEKRKRDMHLSEATTALTVLKGSPVLVPVQSAMTVLLPPASAGPKPANYRAFPPVVTIQCAHTARMGRTVMHR